MNLALVGYGKMGRLIEQLAPEYGFSAGLRLDEFNNADFSGITRENFRGVDVAVEFSIQLFRTGLFKTEYFATLWIDARHDVPNGAIFAGAVHALEDQQQRIAMRCVVKLLQRTQLLNVLFKKLLILLLRLGIGLDHRRPFAEVDLFVWRHTKIRRTDFYAQFPGHGRLVARV